VTLWWTRVSGIDGKYIDVCIYLHFLKGEIHMNRIYFKDNPWPNGHSIKEFEWEARLEPDSGIWFDLHLKSEDYDADDIVEEEEEEEALEDSYEEFDDADFEDSDEE